MNDQTPAPFDFIGTDLEGRTLYQDKQTMTIGRFEWTPV